MEILRESEPISSLRTTLSWQTYLLSSLASHVLFPNIILSSSSAS
jgi:hypothetical protein